MDAFNELAFGVARLDPRGSRLLQIADLVGLPVDAFFAEDGEAGIRELLGVWEAADERCRAEILACVRAVAARPRDAGP